MFGAKSCKIPCYSPSDSRHGPCSNFSCIIKIMKLLVCSGSFASSLDGNFDHRFFYFYKFNLIYFSLFGVQLDYA